MSNPKDDGSNHVTIRDVYLAVGRVEGHVSSMDGRLGNLEAGQDVIRSAVQQNSQRLALVEQECRSRATRCGTRFDRASQELGRLQEGTGRIKLAVVAGQSEASGKRKIIKQIAALVGALASGGALGWLVQYLTGGGK